MNYNPYMDSQYISTIAKTVKYRSPFHLESGAILPELDIAFCTYGKLNEQKSNVIWVCHALTFSADAQSWWGALIGEDKLFDPSVHFIVCANILGSCYGATNPISVNPQTGKPYHDTFPLVTIRDMVKSHQILRRHLGIAKIEVLIGASMGGRQVMEWAIMEPQLFTHIIPIATNAQQSPWAVAFNESQRMAMEADPTFFEPTGTENGLKGLQAARSIAMLSYRHYITYQITQQDDENCNALVGEHRANSYQRYQGFKLTQRFAPMAYYCLTESMDTHDVGRGRGGIDRALSKITAKTLVLSFNTDTFCPTSEQKLIAKHVKGAIHEEIESIYGHDAFCIEFEKIKPIISAFLQVDKC